MKDPSSRVSILKAVASVIKKQGSSRLTLEAVAKEAKLSKGGLLYHFPAKEALISGLIEAACEDFDQAIAKRTSAGMDWLSAYVDAALSPGEADELGPALLGALAENPKLLAPFLRHIREWYDNAREQGGTGAALALLVLDGLFLHQQLGADAGLDLAGIRNALPLLWAKKS